MHAASNGSDARGINQTLSDFPAGKGWLPWLFLSLFWVVSVGEEGSSALETIPNWNICLFFISDLQTCGKKGKKIQNVQLYNLPVLNTKEAGNFKSVFQAESLHAFITNILYVTIGRLPSICFYSIVNDHIFL